MKPRNKVVLYIHGQGGSASESCHYKSLFPECEVLGMDYQTFSPWETGEEVRAVFRDLSRRYADIILIANSIVLTDHSGFYERYGWEFLCMAQGDGEVGLSRMYIHY